MRVRCRVLLSLWLGLSLRVMAEDAISVDDLVKQILSRDPGLTAARAGQEAAEAESQLVGRRPNPEFATEGGLKQVDAEGGFESGYLFSLSLEQPIERRGKREARQGMAAAAIELAELDVALRRRELEAEIRRLAFAYGMADEDARTILDVAARNQALLDMMKQRPAAGVVREFELGIIEASLVDLQERARERAGVRDNARLLLNQLLKRPSDTPLVIVSSAIKAQSCPDAALLDEGLTRNPRLLMADAELNRLTHEAEANRLAAKSDYSVGSFVSHEDAGEQELSVGLSLSMELPWRTRKQEVTTVVDARIRQAQATRDAVVRQLETELAQARASWQRLSDELSAVSSEDVDAARLAADQAERQYRLGVIPFQLYQDVQESYMNLHQHHRDALRNYWDVSMDVYVLTGVTPGGKP